MSEFVKICDLVKRDLIKKAQGKYQIQSEKDSSFIKIVEVAKDKTQDVCLYEEKHEKFICSLISYTLSDEDIKNKKYYMIGYLIKNENKIPIGMLNFTFKPNNINLYEKIDGIFEIVLSNNKNEHKVIREIKSYPGNDNVIYMLTEMLTDILIDIIENN